jgi:hypothetical protein
MLSPSGLFIRRKFNTALRVHSAAKGESDQDTPRKPG